MNKAILIGNLGADPEVRSTSNGSRVATLSLATSHPERVERLVLFGAAPSYARSEDLPDAWTEEQWATEIRTWEGVTSFSGFLDEHARAIAPSFDDDVEALLALRHLLASTMSMGAAIAESRTLSRIDMREVLPSVAAPTLVIRRTDDQMASATGGRFLAEHTVHGQYVEVPGRDSLPWVGDADPILRAIERFTGRGT